jgi:hypothetical protein
MDNKQDIIRKVSNEKLKFNKAMAVPTILHGKEKFWRNSNSENCTFVRCKDIKQTGQNRKYSSKQVVIKCAFGKVKNTYYLWFT